MHLYLVRHGETDWNVQRRIQGQLGARLNAKGKHQAMSLARRLAGKQIDVIISSPTARTLQTARIINKGRGLRIVKDADFREREIGTLEGVMGPKVSQLIPDIKDQWARDGIDWRPPKGKRRGETMREVQSRAIDALRKVVRKHHDKTVLVVTHGAIIKSILHRLHNGKPEDIFKCKDPDNGSITHVEAGTNAGSIHLKLGTR